jgi:dipeptidyl aminopeptidase/acylaminoacyl peptidase
VNVYTLDVRSGALHAVTADAAIEVAPVWSGDGRILYGRRDERGWNVWARRVDRKDAVIMIPDAVSVQLAGDRIYFTRPDRPGVWRWHGSTGAPELVDGGVPAGDSNNWQVAGDTVYAAAGDGRSVVLRRVSLTGGESAPVAELPQYSWPGFSITPDGAYALYARWDRRESNIMAIEGR